jgi:hypothetical protein
MSRYTRRLTLVRFEDSAGLGIDVTPTDGDFSQGEGNAENAEHVKVMDRDQHDGFVLGADQVQECSIVVHMKNESLTHAAQARIEDFVKKRGLFENAQSVDDTIWAWVTILTFDDGTTSTTRTLPICEGGSSLAVGAPHNTINIGFKNHGAPVDA